jgi:hypothetical protein
MDWTMINNAKGPKERIQTIFYLCRSRYEWDAGPAGTQLAEESPGNRLCEQSIEELRAELSSPSTHLGIVLEGDAEVRNYLSALLNAYDARLAAGK